MITKEQIEILAAAELTDTDMYVVEVVISPSNDIELILDSDTRVSIDQCARVSRSIDNQLEALGEDDYSLMVASSGIGNPLKMDRQYKRCLGGQVEVLLGNSKKLLATLIAHDAQSITLAYEEKVAVDGKKRKEIVTREERFPIIEIKSVREALTIK